MVRYTRYARVAPLTSTITSTSEPVRPGIKFWSDSSITAKAEHSRSASSGCFRKGPITRTRNANAGMRKWPNSIYSITDFDEDAVRWRPQ